MPGKPWKFTPEQRELALVTLVRNAGNANHTAEELPFEISADTLRTWMSETEADRYIELAQKFGEELEAQVVVLQRENAIRAAELERGLLERNKDVPDELVPQALRAVADSKSKNIDKLLALTGRPVQPRDDGARTMGKLLEEMASRGYVKLNVELPETVESTATEESEASPDAPDGGEPDRGADVPGTTASPPSGGGRPLPAGSAGA